MNKTWLLFDKASEVLPPDAGLDAYKNDILQHPNDKNKRLLLASKYTERGLYSKAQKEIKRALAIDKDVRTHLLYIDTLIKQRNFTEAREELAQITPWLQIEPEYLAIKARIAHGTGQWQAAQDLWANLRQSYRQDTSGYVGGVQTALAQKNVSYAVGIMQSVPESLHTTAAYAFGQGIILLQQKNPDAAIILLEKAWQHEPHNVDYFYAYASALLDAKKYAQVFEFLQKNSVSFSESVLPTALYGRYFYAQNHIEQADQYLSHIANNVSTYPDILLMLAKIKLQRAHQQGQVETLLNQYLMYDPHHAEAQHLLAIALRSEARFAAAAQVYAQMLAYNPQDADAYMGWLTLAIQQEDTPLLTQILSQMPTALPQKELLEQMICVAQNETCMPDAQQKMGQHILLLHYYLQWPHHLEWRALWNTLTKKYPQNMLLHAVIARYFARNHDSSYSDKLLPYAKKLPLQILKGGLQ